MKKSLNRKTIKIEWEKVNGEIEYKLETPEKIYLHVEDRIITVKKYFHLSEN